MDFPRLASQILVLLRIFPRTEQSRGGQVVQRVCRGLDEPFHRIERSVVGICRVDRTVGAFNYHDSPLTALSLSRPCSLLPLRGILPLVSRNTLEASLAVLARIVSLAQSVPRVQPELSTVQAEGIILIAVVQTAVSGPSPSGLVERDRFRVYLPVQEIRHNGMFDKVGRNKECHCKNNRNSNTEVHGDFTP